MYAIWDNKYNKLAKIDIDVDDDGTAKIEDAEIYKYPLFDIVGCETKKICQESCDFLNNELLDCYSQSEYDKHNNNDWEVGHDEDGFDVSKRFSPHKIEIMVEK